MVTVVDLVVGAKPRSVQHGEVLLTQGWDGGASNRGGPGPTP
jgi:hypothetical protein